MVRDNSSISATSSVELIKLIHYCEDIHVRGASYTYPYRIIFYTIESLRMRSTEKQENPDEKED